MADGEIIEYPEGVYLNQRHEDYLLDVGLGYGGIKDVYLSPTEWWNSSPYNPLRPDVADDEAKKLAFARGAALHTFVLEGERLYDRVYAVRPTKKSHPDAIDTVRELAETCVAFGVSPRGNKPDLIRALIGARESYARFVRSPKAKKADKARAAGLQEIEILAELQEAFDLTGKRHIAQADDFRIRMLHRMMMRSPEELKLGDGEHMTLRDALKGALSEVSIFWVDENGIRQRARFDALKVNITADLKSITQWRKTNFKKALLDEVILRGYMIQAAHYHEARIQLRKAVAEGRVFGGNKTQRKLLERIARSDYWAWVFIFAKMDGAPQVKGMVIRPESGQFIKAQQQREEALANFIYYRGYHEGLELPWFDPEVIWEPAEDEWPLFSVLGQ